MIGNIFKYDGFSYIFENIYRRGGSNFIVSALIDKCGNLTLKFEKSSYLEEG